MSDIVLTIHDLTKRFGGLTAVGNASLEFEKGKIHTIIGPNGAGKTTLINLLSGDLIPTSGTILYKGQDITHFRPDQISQIGIGRSYQKTNIFQEFTCYRNCWIASQSRLASSMKFFRPASDYEDVHHRAEKALELCGLAERRDTPPSEISHGEQRQLEIGMMLATEPDVLLLDEPLAGMGREESESVIKLIKKLSTDHTMVLIEHDMDAVFAIADVLTVMVDGTILASGMPEDIRNNHEVQVAYLGGGEDHL